MMSQSTAVQITKDRLRIWQRRNEKEQHVCTPMMLVNVCHDAKHSGQVIINTTEDMDIDTIRASLLKAVAEIDRQIHNT